MPRRLIAAAVTATALLLATTVPSPASLADLYKFLERVERMAVPTHILRAELDIITGDGDPVKAVLFVSPGDEPRMVIDIPAADWRALLPFAWGKGLVARGERRPVSMSVDEVIPGTDLRPMEFFAFWKTDYNSTFVSDESTNEKTVSLYPPETVPYELFVIGFDKARMVPLTSKYYTGTMSNLARLRLDSKHIMVGSRLRPTHIEIRDYGENRTTTVELAWSVLAELPDGITTDAGFHLAVLSLDGG
ncbi:MAG: hypothetical protein HRT46_00880 [Deltaproteobacteria bacterium]|nr:hypothetical protein [Deltaproteobacteria bacterium]